jgi:hypothetical protein
MTKAMKTEKRGEKKREKRKRKGVNSSLRNS